jgi:hypothetical protein
MSWAFLSALDLSPAPDPSGATDSTAALQNALDLANTGTPIYLPRGTYLVSATLTAVLSGGQPFVLVSDFAMLKATKPLATLLRLQGPGAGAGFELRRLVLNGNQLAQIGLQATGVFDSSLALMEQVEVAGCLGNAISLAGCGPGVLRSVAATTSAMGWLIEDCVRTVLVDCAARLIQSTSGATIRATTGDLSPGPSLVGFHGEFIGRLNNNTTDANAVALRLDTAGATDAVLSGVTIRDLWTEELGSRAVYATSRVRGVVIDAPRIGAAGLSESAIYLEGGATGAVMGAVITVLAASPAWGSISAGPDVQVSGTMLLGVG